jgi:uncharacterized membrane protein YeiH
MDLHHLFDELGIWSATVFTGLDLIAATSNAFNSVILARQDDHNRQWTKVGIILLAILGGIGGSVARDVLLNDFPNALINPWYLILCTLSAVLALWLSSRPGQKSRKRLYGYMVAFALPWYAIVGVQQALQDDLPLLAVALVAIISATAGRYFVDITSGVPPRQFVRGNWFVGSVILASVLYIVLDAIGLNLWPATIITFVVAFIFYRLAQTRGWDDPDIK